MFKRLTDLEFEISYVFDLPLSRRTTDATLALFGRLFYFMHMVIASVTSCDNGSDAQLSFTSLGGIESIPTTFLVFTFWRRLLIYFVVTILKQDFSSISNNFKLQKQPPKVFYKKKVFLEISQNSQENTCARVSFLIKLQAWGLTTYLFDTWMIFIRFSYTAYFCFVTQTFLS